MEDLGLAICISIGLGYPNYLVDLLESILLGRNNHHFETSLAGFLGSEIGLFAWPVATLGYKYLKPEGGFIIRSNIGTLGLGVGLGYAF